MYDALPGGKADTTTDPHVIGVMSNLASVHLRQGRLEEAQLGLRKVLGLQQSLSEARPEHAVALNNLALIYLERGKPASAEAVLHAIRILKDALGPDHPKTFEGLENLATVTFRATPFRRRKFSSSSWHSGNECWNQLIRLLPAAPRDWHRYSRTSNATGKLKFSTDGHLPPGRALE